MVSSIKYQVSSKNTGFTLIEILVYAGLFVIIGVVASTFFIQISNLAETGRRSREALDNANRAMDVMSFEARHATAIYTPTSVFSTNPGQLSLETTQYLPADEDTTYVDFYIDDGVLYEKKEGVATAAVTSQKVKVTNLGFTNLSASGSKDVQINLTVEYKDAFFGPKTPISLTSTASLRSY